MTKQEQKLPFKISLPLSLWKYLESESKKQKRDQSQIIRDAVIGEYGTQKFRMEIPNDMMYHISRKSSELKTSKSTIVKVAIENFLQEYLL